MKIKLTLLISLLSFINVLAQTTLFSENMGSPSGTTLLVNNNFQNSTGTLSYSGGAQPAPADVRNTSVSSGYSGFSAGGNIYFTSSTSFTAYGFCIENINASNYNSLSLQFGYRKELNSVHATFSVDYWDGSSWVTLANTISTLFNENAAAPAGWYLSKSLSLPVQAQINGLKIRFVKSGSNAIRIDDVKLKGTEIPPTVNTAIVTSVNTNSATFGGTVTATGGSNITATGTVYSVTSMNANPVAGGSGVTAIATSGPNSGTGSFLNNSGTALLPNVQYSYNAYATKSTGLSGYGTVAAFYTLAATPAALSVTNQTATTLRVNIGSDGNSAITTYSIFETTTSKYIQADGTLATTEVYQTASAWANKTVTGLTPTTTYAFQVKAKNGEGIETAYSPSASGTTSVLPVINVSGTLTALNTTYGTPSSFNSFTVSIFDMTGSVLITAPAGFEISVTNNGLSGYSSEQILNYTSETSTEITVYIRLAATTGFGTYQGNVTLNSIVDGITVTVATAISTVDKRPLTITGIIAVDKPYDGTGVAYLYGTPVLNGVLPGDENGVTLHTDYVQASFFDVSLGVNKPVLVDGYYITGTASDNYEVIQPTGLTASIAPSEESDFVINNPSPTNNNSNIDYKVYQGTQLTNTGSGVNGSLGIMGFYLRDGGEQQRDADLLPTELTSLSFQVINPQLIRAARLFVGTSPRGSVVMVNGQSNITFDGLTNIIAQDDEKLAINLRVTFNSEVTDNEQVIFIISGATTSSHSSLLIGPDGGGINSVSERYKWER